MKFSYFLEKRRYGMIRLIVISSLIGVIYPIYSDGIGDLRALLNGFFIGFIGSFIIAIFEFVVFNPHSRRLSFITTLILKVLLYFVAFISTIILVKVFIDSIFYNVGFKEYLVSEEFKKFLIKEDFFVILFYTLFFLTIIIFTMQISRKLGQKTLINFITGKYHHPKEEDRIFMHIDLKSSTAIAEKLGDFTYHEFLNEFYSDITKCILTARGEIYRYAGDQVGITWLKEEGLKNENCIRTYFYVNYEMKKQREKFLSKYGLIPHYKAYLHTGRVSTSEVGDFKRQINYYGDPIFELAQIEKKGKEIPARILISETLKNELTLPEIYQYELCNHHDPDASLKCYTVIEI